MVVQVGEFQFVDVPHLITHGGKQECEEQDHRRGEGDDFAFLAHQVVGRQDDKYQKSKNQAHADDGAEAEGQPREQDGAKDVPHGVFLASDEVVHAFKGEDGEENHLRFLGVQTTGLDQDGHEGTHHGS